MACRSDRHESGGGGLLIDTNLSEDVEMGGFATGRFYGVTGRSLLLFVLQTDDRTSLQGFAQS